MGPGTTGAPGSCWVLSTRTGRWSLRWQGVATRARTLTGISSAWPCLGPAATLNFDPHPQHPASRSRRATRSMSCSRLHARRARLGIMRSHRRLAQGKLDWSPASCRSFAVASPGTSGQTRAGKRAPMLGKWPNPSKLSKMSAWAGGLWIRSVLVDPKGRLRLTSGGLWLEPRRASPSAISDYLGWRFAYLQGVCESLSESHFAHLATRTRGGRRGWTRSLERHDRSQRLIMGLLVATGPSVLASAAARPGGCESAGGLKRIELAREGSEYAARRLMAPTANRQYVSPLPSSDERACTNAAGG
jgi:hypothetical protein